MPHDPVNVSTITLNNAIYLFYGTTTASGFYVKTLDAKTFTTKDGIANFIFWIQDNIGKKYDERKS